ncbi:MAG: hypothetical protein HPZ91_08270 [Lentisphaeria bacterium]|nr:hypothetical protein [Lentisphaeria bacterium]
MPFKFKCPNCGAKLEAEEEWVGQLTSCPRCNTEIRVPRENSRPVLLSADKIEKEAPSAKKLTDRSIKELADISVSTTVTQGKRLVRFSKGNRNKILHILELILVAGSVFLLGHAFIWESKTGASQYAAGSRTGYSSGGTGASAYSSSVSVGESSYATAQNTSKLVSNTSDIISNTYFINSHAIRLSLFLKDGICAAVLLLVAIWLEVYRSNLKRETAVKPDSK